MSFVPASDRVGLDVPEQRRIGHRLTPARRATGRREVEAEAVHVHLLHPVRRLSTISRRTIGRFALNVLPVPLKSR
jgi:hypothetical protein